MTTRLSDMSILLVTEETEIDPPIISLAKDRTDLRYSEDNLWSICSTSFGDIRTTDAPVSKSAQTFIPQTNTSANG